MPARKMAVKIHTRVRMASIDQAEMTQVVEVLDVDRCFKEQLHGGRKATR